ncbi:hypothetical protein RIR_jg32676.t1 [Rhizophagus irregularis DAOM 181602=DAOM 197198]|nr:hypothetical protein RIR_jg32676.t1 [Rhizophagus irregularis DAOM 181602=DAOM 197198]
MDEIFRFLLCLNNFHAVTNQESRSSLKGMLSGLYFKPVEEWLKTITKLSFIHVVKKRYNRSNAGGRLVFGNQISFEVNFMIS